MLFSSLTRAISTWASGSRGAILSASLTQPPASRGLYLSRNISASSTSVSTIFLPPARSDSWKASCASLRAAEEVRGAPHQAEPQGVVGRDLVVVVVVDQREERGPRVPAAPGPDQELAQVEPRPPRPVVALDLLQRGDRLARLALRGERLAADRGRLVARACPQPGRRLRGRDRVRVAPGGELQPRQVQHRVGALRAALHARRAPSRRARSRRARWRTPRARGRLRSGRRGRARRGSRARRTT